MLLREILNTKYLTDDYADDVRYLLNKYYACRSSGTAFTEDIYAKGISEAINTGLQSGMLELDLNDCRFTGAVWTVLATIKEHQDCVVLFDSGDEAREEFIRSYMSFSNKYSGLPVVTSLPGRPEDLPSMSNWIKQLRRDVVYNLVTEEYTKNPAFLLAINLLAPDILMDISNGEFIAYAKRVFSKYMLEECTEFYYMFGKQTEFLEARVNENGRVLIPNIGEYDKSTFIQKFQCMPHFIGNETVVYSKASPALKYAIQVIMQDTLTYLKERPVTIESYFPLKEVYE